MLYPLVVSAVLDKNINILSDNDAFLLVQTYCKKAKNGLTLLNIIILSGIEAKLVQTFYPKKRKTAKHS